MSIHGSSSFLEQPQRRGWDDTAGAQIFRTWEGPTSGLATFISGTLPAGYSKIDIEDDSEFCEVVAQYAAPGTDGIGGVETDGLVQRWWELDGNDIEKSLWNHPKVLARTSVYDAVQMASLRAHFEEVMAGTATTSWADPDGVSTAVNTAMLKLAQGIEAFSVSQYVLRKTEIVRTGTSLAASHSNVNRIFSYAALTAAESTLAGYDLVAAAGLTGLEWLKRTPDVRPTQNGLYEIVTEYWGADEWDSWIYDTAV